MFVACGIWCLADVSSVSPSSEQIGELWANHCLNMGLINKVDMVCSSPVGYGV